MKVIGDFHIHSRFARACSTALGIKNLAKWGKVKGISVLGTGDFCHPKYQEEIKQELVREEDGIYYTKDDYPFVLTVEISSMYGDGVKSRKVHNLLMAPSMEVVDQVTEFLGKYGNLTADGRPIIGRKLDCPGIVEGLMSISKEIEITPAHVWTPYFGVFGSISGFNSLEECFKDQTKHIHSIETGMSSTPDMNWRIKDLDNITIMSNSDCHCVHPDTLITLENGYVTPISEINGKSLVAYADLDNLSYKNGIMIQVAKTRAPSFLKKIKYAGGEVQTSDNHRFYTFKEGRIEEKLASQLKEGDLVLRLAKTPHKSKGSLALKTPDVKKYHTLTQKGLSLIKERRRRKNLTQDQIAESIDLHSDNYWKAEKGLAKFNEKKLEKTCKILGLPETFIGKNSSSIFPNIAFPTKSSIQLMELLGYFVGDGCFTKINRGKCLILTDKDLQVISYYKQAVKDLFNCESRLFKYSSQNSYGLVVPTYVAQFFTLNFPEVMTKSKYRQIPKIIYSAPLKEIAAFLRGFFDAEGTVQHHGVSAVSANKTLIYQVDALLKKMGICSSIFLNHLEKTKNKYRHRITLYGEDQRLFNKYVNFNHRLKKIKTERYVEALRQNRKSKMKRVGDFVLSEVRAIETVKSDTDYLYDIAVPGFENYLANQLIVHNSFWPHRLGREANIFELKKLTYKGITDAIRDPTRGFEGTIEVDSSYGKYHFDGHAACGVSMHPQESNKLNKLCPKCGKKMTIGVLNRVEELAEPDRPEGFNPGNRPGFKTLIPLSEVISGVMNTTPLTKKTWTIYDLLIASFGNEYNVLLDVPKEELDKVIGAKLSNAILKNRLGKIEVKPGFDGEYGVPLFEESEREDKPAARNAEQKTLTDF